jgi:CRISPR-associated protein Csx3
MPKVTINRCLDVSKYEFDVVYYDISSLEFATPYEPIPEMPKIHGGCIVVVEGRAPIWRYGCILTMLQHEMHCSAIAFRESGIGAIVILSHSPVFRQGDILTFSSDESKN